MLNQKKWFHFFSLIFFIVTSSFFLVLFVLEKKLLVEFKLGGVVGLPTFSSVFLFDLVSGVFLLMVLTVSYFVLKYAYWYMGDSKKNNFFFIVFFSFIISMVLLSSSSSLVWVMLGWDGLGVTSFCLVMFFSNWKSYNSAMITFLINRFGDFFFIMSIWGFFLLTYPKFLSTPYPILGFFLVLTAMTKSAQVPFSAWLPAAMAAPTPVSSLVHSSTLVTAGVFLVMRFYPLLGGGSLKFLFWFSVLTIFLSGMSAMGESDLKKIIALSTLSHLGFMMFFLSMGLIKCTMVHLMSHAFFKSLLFMAAGVVIHSNNGSQDIRNLSCLNVYLATTMVVAVGANMGIPFLSGFYSKELLLFSFFSSDLTVSGMCSFVLIFSTLFTCLYSLRILSFLFKSTPSLPSASGSLKNLERWLFVCSCLAAMAGGALVWVVTDPSEEMEVSFLSKSIKLLIFAILLFSFFFKAELPLQFLNSKMWFIFEFSKALSRSTFSGSMAWLWAIDLKAMLSKTPSLEGVFLKEETALIQPKKIISTGLWIWMLYSIQMSFLIYKLV